MNFHVGVRFVTFLAWAGMIHAEPQLTIKETQKRIQAFILSKGDINALAEELGKALVESGVIGRSKEKTSDEDEEVPEEEAGEATDVDPPIFSPDETTPVEE